MWIGVALSNAPAPLWLSDINFVTWKRLMVIPLVFVAAGLAIQDRKAIRTVVLVRISLLLIDRTCILESMSRSWANFDESKRDVGPLAYGSTDSAFLAQFAMFFGDYAVCQENKNQNIMLRTVSVTLFATMYTFRAGVSRSALQRPCPGPMKDRKLLLVLESSC